MSAIPVVCAPPRIDMIVPETVDAPATCTNPSVDAVVVNAAVALNATAPFVAIAPVEPEDARIRLPDVNPVPESATLMPNPVVMAFTTTLIPPPVAVIEFAVTKRAAPVDAPLAVIPTMVVASVVADVNCDNTPEPDDVVVPVWLTNKRFPVVMAVAADAIVNPTPDVTASRFGILSAVPVTMDAVARVKTVPVSVDDAVSLRRVVASVAAVMNSERMPVPEDELTPVCSTLSRRPVEVIAVADEAMSTI